MSGVVLSVGKPFWTRSLLSIVDQVLLSGLNFAVGLCLIRFGSKSDYGLYSQLFAASLFAVAVLESLIGSPLTTLAPHMAPDQQALAVRRLRGLQAVSGGVMGLLFGLGAAWIVARGVPEVAAGPAALAFGLFVFTCATREYRRTIWYLHSDLRSLLRSDAVYVLVAALGGAALVWTDQVGAATVLGTLSGANLLAGLVGRGPQPVPAQVEAPPWRDTLALIWHKGKWAVPGTAVSVVGSYSFLYLTSALSGVEAGAEVSAARLPLVPVGLMLVAWSRVARPMAGRLIHTGDWPGLNRLALASGGGMALLSLLYIGLLLLVFPWLEVHLLGAKYQGLHTLVWAWSVFFIVTVPRNIASTWLVTLGAFRPLFAEACMVVTLMMALASALIPHWGPLGAVLALIVMEVFDTLVMLWLIRRWVRRLRQPGAGGPATVADPGTPPG